MGDIKLYFMSFGLMRLEKGWFTIGSEMGKWIDVPMLFNLIVHPEGNVLFDTGPHRDLITNPEGYWGKTAKIFIPVCKEGDDVVSQLANLGYKPEDIDYVVNSHLHLDHSGGNQFFPDSTFLVQKDELEIAMSPTIYQKRSYLKKDFDHSLKYIKLEGDYDIFGDGRVVIIRTIGHSQGSQSLIVRLKNTGTVILTADSCFMMENLEEFAMPGINWDNDEYIKSLMHLREIRERENGWIIPGHDPDVWAKLKKPPEYYD